MPLLASACIFSSTCWPKSIHLTCSRISSSLSHQSCSRRWRHWIMHRTTCPKSSSATWLGNLSNRDLRTLVHLFANASSSRLRHLRQMRSEPCANRKTSSSWLCSSRRLMTLSSARRHSMPFGSWSPKPRTRARTQHSSRLKPSS